MKRLVEIFLVLLCIMFCYEEKVSAEDQKVVWHSDSAQRLQESRKNISKISTSVPQSVIKYAENVYIDLCKVAEEDLSHDIDYSHLKLGEPYIIYDADKEDEQDAIFYFPIIYGQSVDLILEVIHTDEGMKGSISPTSGKFKEKSTYKDSIFYKDGNETCVENIKPSAFCSKKITLKLFSENDNFDKLDACSKSKVISSNVKKYKKIKLSTIKFNPKAKEGYMPGFSREGKGKRVCNTGPYMVSQGDKNICWAACVASTYNYFFNKHISAKTVSKKILGKYQGAVPKQVLKAFKTYGMDQYRHSNSPIKYDSVKKNICHLRLVTATGIAAIGLKHDVVITGYAYTNKEQKIKIYDPSENKWKWIIQDKKGSVVFISQGTYYQWVATYHVFD